MAAVASTLRASRRVEQSGRRTQWTSNHRAIPVSSANQDGGSCSRSEVVSRCMDAIGLGLSVGMDSSVCGNRRVHAHRELLSESSCGFAKLRAGVAHLVGFATDSTLGAVEVAQKYACRWPIEVFFEEARAWLGWGESAQRVEAAVPRMTPFVGWIYTLLVVWFAEGAWPCGPK